MKGSLTEMNNLQGINSSVDEAENQISNLGYKEAKNVQSEEQKETKESKKNEATRTPASIPTFIP